MLTIGLLGMGARVLVYVVGARLMPWRQRFEKEHDL